MKSENILYQDKPIFLIYNDKSIETKMITKFLSEQNCEYFLLSGKEYWKADTFLKDYIEENAIIEVKEKDFEHKQFLTPKELESFENQGMKYNVEKILYNKDQPIYSIGLEFDDDKSEKIIELKGLEQVEKIIGEKLDEEYKMLYGEQQKTLEGFIAKPYQTKNNISIEFNTVKSIENEEQTPNVEKPIWKPTPKKEIEKPKFIVPNVKIGDTVIHKAFGEGVVKTIDEQNRITIEFKDATKIFGLEFAFEKGFIKLKENN